MNRIYRSIWNEASRTFVAVAEKVRAKGKPASTQRGQAIEEALVTSAGAAAPQAVPPRSRVRPRALEQRFMFDAAAVSTAIDAAGEAVNHDVQADSGLSSVLDKIAQSVAQPRDSERVAEPVLVRTGDQSVTGGRKEVAFVDSRVADYQTLIAGIGAGIEVRLIDGSQDGLAQLAAWAASNRDYDAIHILSHGSSGVLALGTTKLDLNALDARSDALGQLGNTLTANGDILLYGCNIADGEAGAQFLTRLAALTRADIAASDDLTGASQLGGDWKLEVAVDDIESAGIALTQFDGTLAVQQTAQSDPVAAAGLQTAMGGFKTVAPIDYDFDGDTDFIAFDGVDYKFARNNGSGSFTVVTPNVTLPVVNGGDYTIADFDNDGDEDILAANSNANTSSYFRNDGNGTFTSASDPVAAAGLQTAMGGFKTIAAIDYDSDGDTDFIALDGSVYKFARNNGSGAFAVVTPNVTLPVVNGGDYTIADFDNDGDKDILAADSNANTSSYFRNNGSGSFAATSDPVAAAGLQTAMGGFKTITAIDYDSDGDTDFIALDGANYKFAQNNGSGAFTVVTPSVTLPVVNGADYTIADFDNDGDEDILAADSNANTSSYFRQDGTAGGTNNRPPRISSSAPVDNGTNFLGGSNIVLTFDEVVSSTGGGAVRIYKSSDNSLVESIAGNDTSKVSVSGTQVTINPTATLADSTAYYVLIGKAAFFDQDGMTFQGITKATTLNFTTASAADTTPPVFDVAPAASNVSTSTLTLSASIDEAGTLYYVVVPDGSPAPTAAQVKAGQNGSGASAVTSGNSAVASSPFTGSFNVSGLSAGTAYDIYVVAQDDEGTPNLMASPVKVDVTTAGNPPVFSSAGAVNFAENAAGTVYDAELSSATGAVTFSLSGTDAAKFNINASTGVLTFKGAPDFEQPTDVGANNVYNVTVRASDNNGYTDKAVAITVTNASDVNFTAADSSAISNNALVKSVTAGQTANITFSAASYLNYYAPNATAGFPGGLYAYSGTGSEQELIITAQAGYTFDLASFKFAPDFSQGTNAVKVRFTSGGNTYEDTYVLSSNGQSGYYNLVIPATHAVNDVTEVRIWAASYGEFQDIEISDIKLSDTTAPTVSSVTLTAATGAANNTLNAGDVLTATVTMSEATTVTGTPQLALNIGGTTVQANYASGSGSSALTFTYTIQSGQTDLNGVSIAANALTLNGGTLKDAAGNDATLTFAAVADNASYKVDTTAPVESGSASSNLAQTTATIASTSDEAGTMYYVVTTSATPPSAAQVMAGQSNTGAVATKSGSDAVAAATSKSFNLTGLTAATQYHAYFVTVDAAGNPSSVATASFTTAAPNVAPTLTTVGTVTGGNEDSEQTITFANLVAAGNEADSDGTVEAFVVRAVSTGTLRIGTSAGTATAWAAGSNDTIDGSRQAYWVPASNANGNLNAFTVVAKDNAGAESSAAVQVAVAVTAVNDAPTDIALSATAINQSAATPAATIATVSGADPENDALTFTLVSGANATDNSKFVIDGTTLKVGADALAAGSYSIRLRATDSGTGNLVYEEVFTITVADNVSPSLASSTPADNASGIAPSANISVTFNETVVAGTGSITLYNVTTGATVETFNIATGVGSAGGTASIAGSTLTLNPSANLVEATQYAIRVDGTAIKDVANNAFAGIADNTTLNFTTGVSDSAAPLIQSIQRQTPAGEASNAASLVYTVRFNEAVTAADSNDFQLTSTGTASGTISGVSGSGTDTLTITVSSVSGTGTLGISLKNTQNITDIAGNALATAEPADDELYAVDRNAPTLLSINRVGGESSQGGSVQFLVVFSEPVSNADVADFALQLGGTASGTISSISGSGTPVLTVTVSNVAGNGVLGLGLANGYSMSDAVGNALASSTPGTGVAESFVIDSVAPLVTSITRTADSLTTADSVSFDVSFSEATSGVDLSDFSLVTSGTVAGTLSAISGSNGHYRVTVSGISGNGTLGLTFAGGQNITDANGNALTATTPTLGEAYTIDKAAPTVSAINRAGVNQIVAGTSTTAVFTVVFSEVVSGVSAADFTVTGTAANTGISSVSSSDGKTFHVTVGGVNGSSGQTVGLNFSGTVSDRVSQSGSTAFSAGQVYTVGNLLLNEGAIDQAALDALLGVNRDGVQKLVSSSAPVTQVIIIDSRLPGLAQQLSNLAAGTEVWLLDGTSSATTQITQILAQYHNLAAVHLLSHGSEGALYLGAETLSAANLAAQQTTLAAWGSALSASGDFLLYGCDVAKGTTGTEFINAFAAATQADVAASTDLTGASWLGGDWVLEMKINETVAELNIDGYAKTLAPTVLAAGGIAVVGINTDDSFPNQRWAFVPLVNIAAGTVIHFTDAGYTESGSFYDNATNEGHLTWTVPSEILAGTLITVTGSNIDNYTGETGAIGGSSFTFSSTGDQILVYQGTSGSTNGATFVYAFNNGQHGTVYAAGNGSWSSSVSIQQASLLPSGLVSGTSAVALSSNITSGSSSGGSFGFDNMKYNGIKTGTRAELLAAIGNAANWVGDNTTPYDMTAIGNFTITSPADMVAPIFDITPVAGSVTTSGFTPFASLNEAGTVYYVVVPNGATAPNVAEVKAGTASGGGMVFASGNSTVGNGSFDTNFSSVTSLTASTAYDVYFVAKDAANNDQTSVTKVTVTTATPTATITSATYDASTNVLTVTAANLTAGDSIDETKLTLTGQGGASYTLQEQGAVTASSSTSFSLTLNTANQAAVEALLNKAGSSAYSGTTYNLAGASGWNVTANAPADTTGNAVTVANANTSATLTFEAADGTLSADNATSLTYTTAAGVFTVTATDAGNNNAAGHVRYGSAYGDVNGRIGSESIYVVNEGKAGSVTFTVEPGKVFDLLSFYLSNQNGSVNENFVITTSKGGSHTGVAGGTPSSIDTDLITLPSTSLFQGITWFTITAPSGGAFMEVDNIVVANVLSTNTNPTISDVSNQTISEGGATSALAVTIGDTETAASSLTLTGSSSNTTLIPNGNIVISGSGANRTVTITPAANQTGSATITLTVSDGNGGTATDTFTVTVSDVNPVLSNATASVDENAGSGTAVTTVTASGDTNGLVYSITGGTGSSLFDINSSTGAITVKNGAVLNYEAASQYTLTVAVDDEDADTTADSTATLTINLNNLNEAPTDIALTATAFTNTQATAGATLATISGTDPDNTAPNNTLTYALVSGTGDTNNAAFVVDGSSLKVASGSALAAGSYSVRLRVSDGGSLSYEKAFSITVTDPLPTLVSASPLDNSTGVAVSSHIMLTFSEAITLGSGNIVLYDITGNGANSITIDVANHAGQLSINGSTLTINPSADLRAANQYAVQIASTALRDSSSQAYAGIADMTSLNFTTGTTDTQAPIATIIDLADPSATHAGTASIRFSEQVQNVDISDFTLTRDGQSVDISSLSVGGSGASYTLDLSTVTTVAGTYVLTLNTSNITDTSGNALAAAVSDTFVIDKTAPTAAAIVRASATPTNSGSLNFTVVFTEAVSGVDSSDFTLTGTASSGASIASVTRVSDSVYTVAVTGASGNGTLGLNLKSSGTGIADLAGNAISAGATGQLYTLDNTAPSVVGISRTGAQYTSGGSVSFTVTFDGDVSGVSAGDFTLSKGNGVVASDNDITVSGSGSSYTVTVANVSGNGLLGLQLKSSGTGISDRAGNAISAGFSSGAEYVVDQTSPVVTANQAFTLPENMASGFVIGQVLASDANRISGYQITAGDSAGYFSIDADGVITLTAAGAADGAPSRDYETTPNSFSLTVQATDIAGNTHSRVVTISVLNAIEDITPPTASIVVADTALSVGETSQVTITFSEAVTGFTNADLTVANGTLSAVSSSDGGITWTATFTPTANLTSTSNVITLANSGVADAAGNAGSGTTNSNNYAIDTLRPSASIVVADTALSVGETSQVTITFSEAVTGFTNADLTVANGTLSAVSSSDGGTTWTATFTPTANLTSTSNVITLANSGVADAAGNAGSGTTNSNNYAIDTLRPTASIVVADTALSVGETSQVTITFSEAVTGFTNADLTVANGTLSAVSSSDGGTTWTATFTPTANLTSTSNVITLANSGVADAAGNTGSGTSSSGNLAIDTARPTLNSVTVSDTALQVGDTATVTFTFSEAVTGFTAADVTVPSGTLSNLASSDGGTTWTATLTPNSGVTAATNALSVNLAGVNDAAGNTGSGSTASGNIAIDTARPTLSVSLSSSTLLPNQTAVVTFTFSEPPLGFGLEDVQASGGTLSELRQGESANIWLATFTPTPGITVNGNAITVLGGWTDLAGNTQLATVQSDNYVVNTFVENSKPVDTTVETPVQPVVVEVVPPAPTGDSGSEFVQSPAVVEITSVLSPAIAQIAQLVPVVAAESGSGQAIGVQPDLALTQSRAGAFQVLVLPRTGGDDNLSVNNPLRDQSVQQGGGEQQIALPADLFAHTNPNETVVLLATQVDGQPLPAWVQFDPLTGKLIVDADKAPPGEVVVKVIARDSQNREAVTTFKLLVGSQRAELERKVAEGKTTLSAQLQLASRAQQQTILEKIASGLGRLVKLG